MFIPQIIYAFFGSAQHSSLGALSFLSIMIYCSIEYSHSHLSSISLCCAFIQLMQFLLPLEFIFSYISTSALSGFSGMFMVQLIYNQTFQLVCSFVLSSDFFPNFLCFVGMTVKVHQQLESFFQILLITWKEFFNAFTQLFHVWGLLNQNILWVEEIHSPETLLEDK